MRAVLRSIYPYARDAMNLPVKSVADAEPFYLERLGFEVDSRSETPIRRTILVRDGLKMGIAENGGDPSQEGCFIVVDNVETAYAEFRASGVGEGDPNFREDRHGEKLYKVFFVVAPDGLCYCIAELLEG